MPMSAPCRHLALATVIVAAVSGCSSWNIDKHDVFPWSKDEPQTPTKVVAVWSPTVLNRSDRPSTRGFGARLMFYGAKEDKSVMVDGTLVVYAPYDDPEIAISLVVEKGGSGSLLANAAVDIINAWFTRGGDTASAGENTLLQ